MGIFDNIVKRVANEIVKAAPTVTPISQEAIAQALESYGNSVGLPRNPIWPNVPFTPGQPIIPGAINPVREDGRPDPRRYEYQVAQNINITPTRPVPYQTLRAAADQVDILRRCIEVLKKKMIGLDWDIVLGEDAAEKIMAESNEKSINRAMAKAKEEFAEDINRLKQFWEVPDVANGMIFADWLNMALEDILVLDAWAVWPLKTVGGELKALQILDGSTIKPLIDDRGMRPQAPFPAYQQILFGFPRSEFAAPQEEIEADGEFSSDELAFMIRNRRSNSVYGYSEVERSLPIADIYLRRQQWVRAEYTDGVIPELLLKSDGTFTPDQLRAYENVLNDYLAGQTEQRKRANILPANFEPIAMDGYGEKFKSTLDDFLVTAICGHFGVQPSEIGMAQAAGLGGGAGLQDGQASSSEVIGLVPLANWVGKMLTQLSYVFLGMPRELEFKFMPSVRNDGEAIARTMDVGIKNGTVTRNEARAKLGLPLLDAPEADLPIIETAAGTFVITAQGLEPLAPANEEAVTAEGDAAVATTAEGKPAEGDPKAEPAKEEPVKEEPAKDEKAKDEKPAEEIKKYSEDQARDEHGRFGSSAGGDPSSPISGAGTVMQDSHDKIERAHSAIASNIDHALATAGNNPSVRTAETLARDAKDKLDQARDARNAGDFAGAKDLVNNAATSLRDAAGRMEEFHVQTNNNPAAQAMANHGSTISNANRTYNQANALANKAAGTEVLAEVRKFKKWLNRKPNKPFNFEYLDETYASTLNKFIAVGDHDGARWYVNEYL